MTRVVAAIPAHNPGPFLARSLASVLAQTHRDLDVVVVDDGSREDIAGTPGLEDPRVRVIRQPNRGVSAARNLAAAVGDGDYVAFLDQDDEWRPTKIERQLEIVAEHPGAAFVHTRFDWVMPHEVRPSRVEDVDYRSNLAGRGYVCLSSIMVGREQYAVVGGHDVSLAQQQDWDLVLKLLRMFGPAVCVEEALVRYHVHGTNTSNDYAAAAAESDRIYAAQVFAASDEPEVLDAVRRGRREAHALYASKAVDAARAALHVRDYPGVARHLAAAARLRPGSIVDALPGAPFGRRRFRRSG